MSVKIEGLQELIGQLNACNERKEYVEITLNMAQHRLSGETLRHADRIRSIPSACCVRTRLTSLENPEEPWETRAERNEAVLRWATRKCERYAAEHGRQSNEG